jgi:hypothetical protein
MPALYCGAVSLEVGENWFQAYNQATRFRLEANEKVHVRGRNGFKVESCTHRAAYGITVNDAVCLHPVDGGDDFFYTHAQALTISRSDELFQLHTKPSDVGGEHGKPTRISAG